jgi:hypothetical protein
MSELKTAALVVLSICAAPALAQQEPAGRILWAYGEVERLAPDGVATALAKGDPVFEGDVIRSGAGSHAHLLMKDEALMAVRAGSSVRLAQYRYAGREDGSEHAVIELIKGGLRSITGAIGRSNKDNYQLKNEMHVIGIRGTDHETFATDEGTYNRVTLGGTYLKSDAGRLELSPGETGFVAMRIGAAPSRLQHTPEFMHVAAVSSGNTGLRPRGFGAEDQRRLQRTLPSAQAPSASAPATLPLPGFEPGEHRGRGRSGDRSGNGGQARPR